LWMMSTAWARRGGDRSRPVGAAEIDVFEGYGTVRGSLRDDPPPCPQ
jgi:hypothetical protein